MLDFIRSSAESWLIKVAFGIIIIVFVLGFGYSALRNPGQSGAGALAYVNGSTIGVDDFLARTRLSYPSDRLDELRKDGRTVQLLNDMVREELLVQEANKLGISISDQEVQHEIMQLTFFQNLDNQFDRNIYERQLANIGISTSYFENVIRRTMLAAKVTEYVTLAAHVDEAMARQSFDFYMEQASVEFLAVDNEDFYNATEVTDQDLADYYDAHSDDFRVAERLDMDYLLFTPTELAPLADVSQEEIESYYEARKDSEYLQQERVKAKHILIPVQSGASEDEVEAARQKAQAVYDRLEAGESYDDIFAEFESGESEGLAQDLGWFPRGQMAAEFEQAAFDVPAGTYSEPVLTMFGWHVILVQDHEDAHPIPLEDLEADIREVIAEKKAQGMINEMLDTAIVQVYAGDSLETIAADLGMAVRQSGLFSMADNMEGTAIDEDALPDLFALGQDATTDWPVPVDQGFLLGRITEKRPAELRTLDEEEVHDAVYQAVMDEQAKEMARARADEILAQVQGPGLDAELEAQLLPSSPFFRSPDLNFGLSVPQEILDDAFAAEPGQWLPRTYEDAAGFVIVRLKEISLPTDEQWEESRVEIMDSQLGAERDVLFSAFFQTLLTDAEIETVDQAEPYWKPDEVSEY